MAIQSVRIGSMVQAVTYDDAAYDSAIETDQPIKAGAPVDPNDVVILGGISDSVTGPGSSVDHAVARWDGVTGTLLQDSLVTISDTGGITIPNGLTIGSVGVPTAISINITGYVDIGGGSDYTSFGPDGRMIMAGDAKVEKQKTLPPAKNRTAGVGVPPPSAVFGNHMGLEFDIGDKAYYEIEIPYDCDVTEDIEIEVHWFIDEANDDLGGANEEQVQWRASYTLTKEDATEAIDAASTDLDTGDVAIPSVAKYLVQSECGEITGGLVDEHDILGICIERLAVTKDDPANDPILLNIEIEYISNQLGHAV